jgi:FKBP-type peptidyl-prolyl cis-trans isomerase SlyD
MGSKYELTGEFLMQGKILSDSFLGREKNLAFRWDSLVAICQELGRTCRVIGCLHHKTVPLREIVKMIVAKNKVVSVHYVLRVDHEGEKVVADQSEAEAPLKYLHGGGMLLPDFELNLEGLQVGDTFEFSITAESGYGLRNDQDIVAVPLDSFKDEEGNIDQEMVRPGSVLPMVDQQGNRFQGIVVDVTPDQVIMDFNHPLAGKDLYFSGSVAEVREASAEEIDHGHVHGEGGHHH